MVESGVIKFYLQKLCKLHRLFLQQFPFVFCCISFISQYSKFIKIKTAYGTIPSASSGQVYPQYPEGTSFQAPVLALRIWDANNNILVNPSWAEVRLYQNNAFISFSNIPQSSQGGTYYLDFATTL